MKWILSHVSQSDLKCYDRLLKGWRPITCFLVIIERNSRNKFQPNYLQNRKHFLIVLLHFWKLHKNFSILKTEITFIPLIILELFSNMYLLECVKVPVSEHCLEVNVLSCPKHCSICTAAPLRELSINIK